MSSTISYLILSMEFDSQYPSSLKEVLFSDCRATIVLEDKKGGNISYMGNNKCGLPLVAYRVDGGLISDEHVSKCDFALYTKSSRSLRLIELKGSDLDKACEQISSSMGILLSGETQVSKLYGRIVLTKVRPVDHKSTKVKKLKELLAKNGGNLLYKSREMVETID